MSRRNHRNQAARLLVALRGAVLLLSAGIHWHAGFAEGFAALRASNLEPPIQDGSRTVFLLAGWDWVVIAAVAVLGSWGESRVGKPLVTLCAVALLVEAGVMLAVVGVFAGTLLVGAAALLMMAGGVLFESGLRAEADGREAAGRL